MQIKKAREVIRIEADAVRRLINKIDNNFKKAAELVYNCQGRVVVTGMGKAGLIGQKISATLASTGTPSLSLHPAEAIHGDLGRVTKDDVVIALSSSGETEEITKLLPLIKKIGAKLIAITGNLKSTLSRYSDVTLDVSVKKEACPLGIVPTASTTVMLALGDALSVVVLEEKNFGHKDFAFFHPGGNLGKRLLLTVDDIMRKGKGHAVVREDEPVKKALFKITASRSGSATVVDKKGMLKGIFTDGDLRRHLEIDPQLVYKSIKLVMTKNPKRVKLGSLAVEALKILNENKIDEIPVVDETGRAVGLIDVQDLLKAGLV